MFNKSATTCRNKSARSIFLVRNSGACLLTQKQANKNNYSLYESPFIAGDRQIEVERKIDANNWILGTLSLLYAPLNKNYCFETVLWRHNHSEAFHFLPIWGVENFHALEMGAKSGAPAQSWRAGTVCLSLELGFCQLNSLSDSVFLLLLIIPHVLPECLVNSKWLKVRISSTSMGARIWVSSTHVNIRCGRMCL